MRFHRLFAILDLLVALLVAIGVFVGLPSRWALVDVPAAILILLFGSSALGLFLRVRLAEKWARITGGIGLGLGLLLVALLCISASYLAGVYGAVGQGGAIIFTFVLFLVVPYLVVLPLAQLLFFLRPLAAPSESKGESP